MLPRSGLALAALLISAIGSASAASPCQSLTRITTIDTIAGPGHYMLVPVTIADTQQLMVFDTGGAISNILLGTANQLKIPVIGTRTGMRYTTGSYSAQAAIIPSVRVGNIEVKQARFMIMPDDVIPEVLATHGVAGLLAPTPGVDVDLDFAANRLSFFSPDHCEGEVVYWPAPTVAVVPMRVTAFAHIVIPVTLDGQDLNALVDTGADVSTLALQVASERFASESAAANVESPVGGNPRSQIPRRVFKSLSFEGVTVANPELYLEPEVMTRIPDGSRAPVKREFDIKLGMSLLSKTHIYIANKERRLYITAAENPESQPPTAVRSGPPAFELSGSWDIAGPPGVTPICDVVQTGGDLTGSCRLSGVDGQLDLTGTVAGQAIRWQWKYGARGDVATSVWNFSGTMNEHNVVFGFGELNGRFFPFTARKQVAGSAP